MNQAIHSLTNMLLAGTSPYGAVLHTKDRILAAGGHALSMTESWSLSPGSLYYVNTPDSSVIAFTTPAGCEGNRGPFLRMAAAHTDYPSFRLKPDPDFSRELYVQLNTEGYGGALLSTWLDRPLGVAGKVCVCSKDPFRPDIHYFDSKKPILTIPSLAIHMNRDANKGTELNKQLHMMPIADILLADMKKEGTDRNYFINYLAASLSVEPADILDFDLIVYNCDPPQTVGIRDSLLLSPRLDNLTSCAALVDSLLAYSENRDAVSDGIRLIALFDNEEIGSGTKQGAATSLLRDVILRIFDALSISFADGQQLLYDSILLSTDVAHGTHPNYMQKMDPIQHPSLGNGICIKTASQQSYATDTESIAIFEGICQQANVPYQRFVNRSDSPGGSTLGALSQRFLPIRTIDLGVPILAMHSACELMAVSDQQALKDAVTSFFEL